MSEIFFLYRWSILAGAIHAASLSILGCHLAGRDRAMQTVCLSQAAMLGVLLSLGISLLLGFEAIGQHQEVLTHILPFLASMLCSGAVFSLTQKLTSQRAVSKNTVFASIFAVLLAASYLVTSAFPGLESHMAQAYFGDLATATQTDSLLTLLLGSVGLLILILYWKPITNRTFELAVFGENASSSNRRRWNWIFDILTLLTLSFSVQFVGFLFTVACLFIPTTILSSARSRGVFRHFTLCGISTALGTASGFALSLLFTRISTVPSVVLFILALSLLTRTIEKYSC